MAVDHLAALRASPLLREFSDVGLKVLADAAQERNVGRGVYAFRAGEPSAALAFVVRGTLQLLGRDGGAVLGEISAGDTLGGLSLLASGEHLVSALASNDVCLLQLSRDSFAAVQQSHPRTALKLTLALARDLTERMQEARAPLREFLVWQVSKRQSEPR
jgi:CRP-like cAMP-binding protein